MHQRNRTTLSEINVTPLVDVMLVLLIIFMVTAPMLQQGVEVQLPVESGDPLTSPAHIPVVITLQDENRLYVNDQRVTLTTIEGALIDAARTQREVFIRADTHIPYGFVMKIMTLAKKAGVEKLGMVTNPLEK
jgi:biopolymer transport protein TolR